ncbi:MAG: hypothetical protein IJ215_01365 [Clostridia bacterium]|nr:hypothetical protein [Clostridia bacterium]
MKKNGSKRIKAVIVLTILISMFSTSVFAAWWGTPGYEWARERRITSMASTSALNNKVSHENFYTILINYLHYKEVTPKNGVIQNVSSLNSFNKALGGIVSEIDSYISRTSLTPAEYRIVDTYINHIDKTLDDQKSLLTRDNLKDMHLYMDIARYKAATLIDDYSYRTYVLARIKPTKYSELIRYNIRPYFGDITRREFLVLMFSLLSNRTLSQEAIITEFNESGVLIGYDGDLWLDKNLTYAEMFTFLRRFETFDFNPVVEDSSSSGDNEIIEVR